ncbi:hypothetical protein QEN19_003641 [Hanseniaspora menglaensis]
MSTNVGNNRLNAKNLEKIDNTLDETKKIYYSVLDKQIHENIFKPLNDTLAHRQQANIINRYNNVFLNEISGNKFNTNEFHDSLDDLNVSLNNLKSHLILREKKLKNEKKLEIIESNKFANTSVKSNNSMIPSGSGLDAEVLGASSKGAMPGTRTNDPFNLDTNGSMNALNGFGIEGITSATATTTSNLNTTTNQPLGDFGIDLSMFGFDNTNNNLQPTGTDTNMNTITTSNNSTNANNNNSNNNSNKGGNDLMTDLNINDFNLDAFDLNLDMNSNGSNNNSNNGNNASTNENTSSNNPNFEFNFDWE